MQSLRASAVTSALAILFLTVPLLANSVQAQTVCPPGSIPITAANRAAATIAGIPVSSSCWQQTNADVGQDVAQAKTYLRSILCPPDGDNYGGMGADGTIQGLDPKFAQCASTFLKALNGSGSGFCIREGKRSVEKQNAYVARGVIACKKGAMCEHPRGIAIDINATGAPRGSCTSYTRAHQMAGQYGLTFYLGCRDAYHFVPQRGGCSAGGTPAAPGSPTAPNSPLPASYYDYPQYAPAGAPAASPFSTALSALMPVATALLTPTPTTANNQPTGTTQTTPTQTTTPINPLDPAYTIPTPTPTTTIVVPASGYIFPNGTQTSGTTQNPATSTSFDSLLLYANTNTNTTNTSGVSTGVSTQGTGSSTSSPVRLNDDLSNLAYAESGTNIGTDDTLAVNYTDPSVTPPADQILVTQTFSNGQSTESGQSASTTATNLQKESMIRALLITLRDFLVSFLNALKAKQSNGFAAPWQAPTAGTFK